MNKQATPFKCHIFVCVNDRHGVRKSCADGDSVEIYLAIKQGLKDIGIKNVRVSQSLCLGVCERGPNIMIYPQGIWFSSVTIEDVDVIVKEIVNISKSICTSIK